MDHALRSYTHATLPHEDGRHPNHTTLALVLMLALGVVLSLSLTSHRTEPVDDHAAFPMRAP